MQSRYAIYNNKNDINLFQVQAATLMKKKTKYKSIFFLQLRLLTSLKNYLLNARVQCNNRGHFYTVLATQILLQGRRVRDLWESINKE